MWRLIDLFCVFLQSNKIAYMVIDREILINLISWKNSEKRKPLILQGARQVGKTWIMKDFGTRFFEDIAYFNFDEQVELKKYFEQTKDVERLLQHLTFATGKPIVPQKTLLIFDEIQECNAALNSLKYFNENAPEYAIICAGSLLGVALSRGSSFPVGKVDFLTLHPISFKEFLKAADSRLYEYLNSKNDFDEIPDFLFNPIVERFKMYFITGGMPEAIVEYLDTKDSAKTQLVLQNIINSYQLDFSKYTDNQLVPKIVYVWNSIPSQLAKENKKFIYQVVKPGARAREYEDALLWLNNAGLTYRINCNTKPALPLSAYDDLSAYKIFLCDVGLLRRLSGLDPIAVVEGNRLFTEFKGALTENYILQSLILQFEHTPRYWTSGNKAEVDFLIQYKNDIFPIEVKSNENVKSRSLTLYNELYQPKLRIRFSLRNLKLDGNLMNIPLFMADFSTKLIENYFENK